MLIPQKFTDQGIADPQVQRYVPKNDVLSREFAQSFSTIIINACKRIPHCQISSDVT